MPFAIILEYQTMDTDVKILKVYIGQYKGLLNHNENNYLKLYPGSTFLYIVF